MNDFAKRWVAALRSGEYEQGYRYLNKDNKFCAFGVACELMRDKLNIRIVDNVTHYNYNKAAPPIVVRRNLGLKETNVAGTFVDIDGNRKNIFQLNDSGVPFTEIADLIEQHQGELFSE